MLGLKVHLDPCGIGVLLTTVIAKPPLIRQKLGEKTLA